jgi:protein N-terminal methyltransferase
VVKENLSTQAYGAGIFDELDSSVTRSDQKFRDLFTRSDLHVVKSGLQTGFSKGLGLYPVRMYALQTR